MHFAFLLCVNLFYTKRIRTAAERDRLYRQGGCPHSFRHKAVLFFVFSLAPIRHYFPERRTGLSCMGSQLKPALVGGCHGNFTPAGFSGGCTLCVRLRLCRSIMIGCSGHGGAIYHRLLFGRTVLARHL